MSTAGSASHCSARGRSMQTRMRVARAVFVVQFVRYILYAAGRRHCFRYGLAPPRGRAERGQSVRAAANVCLTVGR
eukprot:10827690-Lingulodinium_polyedra.AAC.1